MRGERGIADDVLAINIAGSVFLLCPIFCIVGLYLFLLPDYPIFFHQERVGKDGKIFVVWKFRTMDDHGNVLPWRGWLRRLHFDEAAQLINIILGEMNLIGARPLNLEDDAKGRALNWRFVRRYRRAPGVTGPGQVSSVGKSVHFARRGLALDLWYIRNRTFILDLFICVLTLLCCLRATGK